MHHLLRDFAVDISSDKQTLFTDFTHLTAVAQHVLRTAWAFTHSDFKTIVIPVIVYALMATPPQILSVACLPRLMAWVFIHLIEFCTANQMYSGDEDAINKPYRPIPAKLITVEGTFTLRWSMASVCLALSYAWGVGYSGLALALSFFTYNELGLDAYWYTKSLLNAIGIVSWNVGAAAIARGDNFAISDKTWIAPYLSVALIWSTIHIQDFRDEQGDRLSGRITVPILMPKWSRVFTPILLLMWSIGLSTHWDVSVSCGLIFNAITVYLAHRIYTKRTEHDDKVSLRIYMLWLTVAQISPFWAERSYH